EPGEESAEFDPPEVRYARRASNGCERTLVSIVERAQRLPFGGADDVVRRVLTLLNRRGRYTGNILDMREVADDARVAMAGHGQVAFDHYAAGAVERRAEAARERRRLHAGAPQDGARRTAGFA